MIYEISLTEYSVEYPNESTFCTYLELHRPKDFQVDTLLISRDALWSNYQLMVIFKFGARIIKCIPNSIGEVSVPSELYKGPDEVQYGKITFEGSQFGYRTIQIELPCKIANDTLCELHRELKREVKSNGS